MGYVSCWVMLIGGLGWLIGELWGVSRNFATHRENYDTTSEWVWAAEQRWPFLRVLVAIFCLSLTAHFLWRTPLLP